MIKNTLLSIVILFAFNNFTYANAEMSEKCKKLVAKYKNYRGACNKEARGGQTQIGGVKLPSLKLPSILGTPAPPSKIGNLFKGALKKK